MRLVTSQAVLVSAAIMFGAPQVGAQPSPQPPNTTRTVSPTDGFGATYGTSNLANPPTAIAPQRDMRNQGTTALRAEDFKAAQERRTQPPRGLPEFKLYLRDLPIMQILERMSASPSADPTTAVLLQWNHVALDMTSIDHTTAGTKISVPGSTKPVVIFEPTYGEQFGPPRSSRALAIVHLAMFEAANAVDHRFGSYSAPSSVVDLRTRILSNIDAVAAPTSENTSIAAAISQAAHDTLAVLYPKKTSLIDAAALQISILVAAQEQARGPAASSARLALGGQIGAAAAQAVTLARETDNSDFGHNAMRCRSLPGQDPRTVLPPPLCFEAFFPADVPRPADPLAWTPDAIIPNSLQLGANWKLVTPFVLKSREFIESDGIALSSGKRLKPSEADAEFIKSRDMEAYGPMIPDPHDPTKMISSQYGVRRFGGWNPPPGSVINFPPDQGTRAVTGSLRDDGQTQAARFWGYDATALLCAPPRLYNMIATSFLADHMASLAVDHQPVEMARYLALVNLALADAGIAAWDAKYTYGVARPITYLRNHTPPAVDDGTWTPLGQVGSNGAPDNVTPPFPSYPSGHAVFGAAAFKIMSKVLGLDMDTGSSFDFMSDEFNGHTFGSDGRVRDPVTAHFVSLRAASWENAESRVWLGIHWQRDADDGVALGDNIADVVFVRVMQPLNTP